MKKNRALTLLATTLIAGSTVTACSHAADGGGSEHEQTHAARKVVDPRFGDHPHVVADLDFSGIDASKLFFDSSHSAVVSGTSRADQLRAASIAVASHTPMLMDTGTNHAEVLAELNRLKATTVLLVGDTDFAPSTATTDDGMTFIADEGSLAALEAMTSQPFETTPVDGQNEDLPAIAGLDPKHPHLLVPAAEAETTAAPPQADAPTEQKAFPAGSARDAGQAPTVLVSPFSGIAAAATARAWGADLTALPYSDPRISDEGISAVAGLTDSPVVALGAMFGSDETFQGRIALSSQDTAELPGGGHLVFPGRRMVALYGHPSGPALGVMGEQDPQAAVARVKELVAEYQKFSEEPVVPAFEIIATVAAGQPGQDGDYSNEAAPEELTGYIDAITQAGGYAVLDLQPGRARLLDQAQRYTELLKRPNVGLALDPEWKIGPNELPLQNVGHVEAGEVNEVGQWLANLVRENNLPQKAFVLHQFQVQMIRNRENVVTDYPELALVLHADGHGAPAQKFDTWNVLRQGLDPRVFLAWKNFYDEDQPTFTPEQTMQIDPRPWFVSYQ